MKHITIFFLFIIVLSAAPAFTQTTVGYIISGSTHSYTHGESDFLVYRIDPQGNKQWRKNYGSAGDESAGILSEMANGSFALAGGTKDGFGHDGDCIIYLLSDRGRILWRRIFGPSGNYNDQLVDIHRTTDGGFIAGGRSDLFFLTELNNGLVAKVEGNGNTSWWHVIPNTSEPTFETFTSIQQTADNAYIATTSYDFTESDADFCLDKLDENGYRIWQKRLGGAGSDFSIAVRQTADGGYILAGATDSYVHGTPGLDIDYLVYKLDSGGKKQWRKNFGGDSMDLCTNAITASDGGYVLIGVTLSYTHGGMDILVYKIDAAGKKIWRKNYGGSLEDMIHSIKQTSDGGYIMIGFTNTYTSGGTDMLVYKIDARGRKQWRKNYGGLLNDTGRDVIEITQ